MTRTRWIEANLLPCVGLVAGPTVFLTLMELGLMLPPADCRSGLQAASLAGIAGLVVVLGAAVLSWWSAVLKGDTLNMASAYPRSLRFVGSVGSLSACIFAFAIMLQLLATLLVDPCQR